MSGGNKNWFAITSSSDGTKLAAVSNNIWTSTDSGGTWTEGPVNTKDKYWQVIASSSDGTKLAAAVWNGAIWTSADSGATWTERTVGLPTGSAVGAYPAPFWNAIASSSDGTNLAAGAYPGGPDVAGDGNIYTSADSGGTWTERTVKAATEGERDCGSIASSSDGTKLAAVAWGCSIWTSTDSGGTWTKRFVEGGNGKWEAIASSSDGTKLAAVATSGNIWTSADSGGTWTESPVKGGGKKWVDIASSSDGSKLAAVVSADCKFRPGVPSECAGGAFWTSTDGGQTWTESV